MWRACRLKAKMYIWSGKGLAQPLRQNYRGRSQSPRGSRGWGAAPTRDPYQGLWHRKVPSKGTPRPTEFRILHPRFSAGSHWWNIHLGFWITGWNFQLPTHFTDGKTEGPKNRPYFTLISWRCLDRKPAWPGFWWRGWTAIFWRWPISKSLSSPGNSFHFFLFLFYFSAFPDILLNATDLSL